MSQARTLAVLAVAVAGLSLGLTGCGTEDPNGAAGTTIVPETETPTIAATSEPADDLGTMILNRRLDVPAAQYPLPDAPTEAEVATVAELGEVYSTVPGIDGIVADLQDTTLGADERLFVYLVNSCTTKEVALAIQGKDVPMIVSGTARLRCAPPTTMVVWVVGDEIPADAKPAHAIQQ
jgi:hypothetical protein